MDFLTLRPRRLGVFDNEGLRFIKHTVLLSTVRVTTLYVDSPRTETRSRVSDTTSEPWGTWLSDPKSDSSRRMTETPEPVHEFREPGVKGVEVLLL